MGLDDKLIRKKLEVLLKDEALVEKYLRVFGPRLDMNNIAKLKQDHMRAAASDGAAGDKDDPTFQIKVKCPICNQNEIVCLELKAKSLTTTLDRFCTPRYQGVKGFRPLNYTLEAVTVCPNRTWPMSIEQFGCRSSASTSASAAEEKLRGPSLP